MLFQANVRNPWLNCKCRGVLPFVFLIHKVEMSSSDWQLSLKLVDQPKSTFTFPEMMPGDVPPGGYRVATLKQLVAAQLPDSIPDPDLIGLWHLYTSIHACPCFHDPCLNLICFVGSYQSWSTVGADSRMTWRWMPVGSNPEPPYTSSKRLGLSQRAVQVCGSSIFFFLL